MCGLSAGIGVRAQRRIKCAIVSAASNPLLPIPPRRWAFRPTYAVGSVNLSGRFQKASTETSPGTPILTGNPRSSVRNRLCFEGTFWSDCQKSRIQPRNFIIFLEEAMSDFCHSSQMARFICERQAEERAFETKPRSSNPRSRFRRIFYLLHRASCQGRG